MKQVPGQSLVLPVIIAGGGVPVGNVGADMTMFQSAAKVYKYAIKVTLSGGTSTQLRLYVREATSDAWMLFAPVGLVGLLSSAALNSSGTYVFVVQDLGIFDRVAIGQSNDVGGTVTTIASITEYIENNNRSGD